jgi:hypothetical protein
MCIFGCPKNMQVLGLDVVVMSQIVIHSNGMSYHHDLPNFTSIQLFFIKFNMS